MAANGVYIVLGEVNTVVALLNKARRQYQLSHQPPSLEDTDPLLRNFADLKDVLNKVVELSALKPVEYLTPFLEVIKAQNTNGPITEAALSSVAKFLTYGLIETNSKSSASIAVNAIADAVVHTKFIGGKSSGSDECVLFKILLVLRSLLLSPPGAQLSNEAVCDMMQSCFRIVFEQHLSPLLRKAAEATLTDTTQLIFTRLSTFNEDTRHPYIKQLVMNSKGEKRRHRTREFIDSDHEDPEEDETLTPEKTASVQEFRKASDAAASQLGYDVVSPTQTENEPVLNVKDDELIDEGEVADSESEGSAEDIPLKLKESSRVRSMQGVSTQVMNDSMSPGTMPYGLPCCRELLRFLIALTNPLDRANTESMVILGLNLITVALEAAADHLVDYTILMPLIRDKLCRSLLQLLDTEKLPVLAATNRVCFLLFESIRNELKFQLEAYLHKLKGIIRSEQRHSSYEQKEMALESLVQLWRIPGLVTELYFNYDCDLYSSNVFEELTELLKDMSFPMSGLGNTSLLALDALLVVIDTIDDNCVCKTNAMTYSIPQKSVLIEPILSGMEVGRKIMAAKHEAAPIHIESSEAPVARANRHLPSENLPLLSDVIQKKERKRILAEGTDIFNKEPKQGINFLREKGILDSEPSSIVQWLRTNSQLDKKKIADYICNRKHGDVLAAFVQAFPFENTRLDEALRIFLESFRLPGESAEISMVMQHFSEQWYKANNEPFNHVDAAFTLSYAIIMLNTDQHNPQARRNQPPMTIDCFRRNLSGTNAGQDFDQEMLLAIYNAIKSDEIVMPAEQTGLVKENYLWKVLLRRGEAAEGVFLHAPTGWNDHSLFSLIWGPTISTLSYVFSRTEHDVILNKVLNGYRKCASIAAFFGMENVFDNLVITLCKFSTLTVKEANEDDPDIGLETVDPTIYSSEATAVSFGSNHKAQEALRVLFELVHKHGDMLRESWTNMIHTLLALFKAHLLPPELTEVDDFVDEKGWVSIIRSNDRDLQPVRSEVGLLSWFGLGSTGNENERKKLTQEQLNSIKVAKDVVKECLPANIIRDSKYVTASALKRLVVALRETDKSFLQQKKKRGESEIENEDMLVFVHELIVAITLENKDRIVEFWPDVQEHTVYLLSLNRCPVLVERAVVGILRIANRNLFRDNTVADDVFVALSHLLNLPHKAFFVFSRQISNGLHELLRNNAQDIHRQDHWQILFSLMERAVFGDDANGTYERNAYSDIERPTEKISADDRGYTSADGYHDRGQHIYNDLSSESRADSAVSFDQSKDWIHLDKKDADRAIQDAQRALFDSKNASNRTSLVLRPQLGRHEPAAFLKICDCLDFVLRESAPHITPENLDSSIHCLLTMVEASLDGGRYAAGPISGDAQNSLRSYTEERKRAKVKTGKKELSTDVQDANDKPSEEQQISASYQQVSLHLLSLCSNLHGCAYNKLVEWAKEDPKVNCTISYVWATVWRPLLQVMARLACDCRRRVREMSLAQLQRSFLNMTNLGAQEWESCFNDVLFPLLSKLLEPFSAMDPLGQEDTRVRAFQIVAKTLLNHLKELSSLPAFCTLWLRLLDFMEKYLRIDTHGTLSEAVPESLKNMLLVLHTTGLFGGVPGLYDLTVQRINPILPQLIRDTIPHPPSFQGQDSSRLPRVQIAPARPAEISSSTINQPVFIPEIPLTEVVVHSGAASPVFPTQSPEKQNFLYEQSSEPPVQQPSSVIKPLPTTFNEQKYHISNPISSNHPYIYQQSTAHYSMQETVMPQADLSKVFVDEQAPQFIPPQELLQQSNYNQYMMANQLPTTHTTFQPTFVKSPTSAFQAVSQPDFNQLPHERP